VLRDKSDGMGWLVRFFAESPVIRRVGYAAFGCAAVLVALCLPAAAAPGHQRAHGADVAPAGDRFVTYRGVRVTVPAAWPVDVGSHPRACLRFDRPVVYLGSSGAQSDCPAHAVGHADTIWLKTDPTATGRIGERLSLDPIGHDGTALFPARGVELDVTWGSDRSSIDQALASAGAPRTLSAATAQPTVAQRSVSNQAAAVAASSTFTGMAFDTCSAPSVATMSAWLGSPYRAAGIYIGGSMRACGDGNLSASWTSQVRSMGWGLLPLYVGIQAPCVYQSGLATITASRAAAQGTASADDAVSRAKVFGLGAGTPVYYDMEAYNSSAAGCTQTVMRFISAWTAELHRLGYKSGAYGSTASLMVDLAASAGSTGFVAPDDVWFAHWNQLQTTSDAGSYPRFSDSYWKNHQRVHQYSGGANQTWGGVSINIDANWVDAAVAGTPVPVNYGADVVGPGSNGFVFTGSMAYWHSGAPAGLKRLAYWTYSNGSTEANGATWSPQLAPGRYDVEAYIPSTNATAKAPYTITDALGTTHRIITQQAPGGYTSLGSYTAQPGRPIVVHVGDNDPSATRTQIGVDAMAFRLILTVPGPPTGVTGTVGNGQSLVSWTAPASDGGTAITGYRVTATPGGRTASTTGARSATVTGLSNATAYTFTVTATNSIGTSVPSAASAPVTPLGPPDAPTGVSATRGNQSATLSWSAPGFDGGSPVTGYTLVARDTSNRNARSTACAGASASTTTSCTATGLTNGHAYTFTVAAANAVGTGPTSAASAVVIPATVPGAPTRTSAAARERSAAVSWTAPNNGGSPITGYIAKAEPGGATCSPVPVTSTTCTIPGLADGTAYTVTVTASNSVGPSPAGAPASVVPLARSSTTPNVPAAITYGHAYAIAVIVTSTEQTSGSVTAVAAQTTLGTATLGASTYANGVYTATARITVSGTAVPSGTARVVVMYHGSAVIASSASAPRTMAIAKEPTTTTARLSSTSVRHWARARITVRVTAWATTPTGLLAIYNGSTRIGVVTLRSSNRGTITISLPALRVGTYRLAVHYLGNRNHRPSESRTLTLRSR
jgi:hypothetical protein